MIRILICDDQVVVCEGLRAILGTVVDFEVVGVVHNGMEALAQIAEVNPDLVLMDLKMPEMNGIQATRLIHERYPTAKVLVLTTYDADEWVFDAIRGGADGYILKDTPREGLIVAIRGTIAGGTHVDPQVAGKLFRRVAQGGPLPDQALLDLLNKRERDILRLIARGFSNTEIASRLYLSEGTVRNYVSSIFAKLGVTDRTQAAVLALRAGLGEL